jgi:hypothetical protein
MCLGEICGSKQQQFFRECGLWNKHAFQNNNKGAGFPDRLAQRCWEEGIPQNVYDENKPALEWELK